ncbi:hypothetical protein TNCV_1625971 [Trichonephila clavipes]|nr:hypothetical protein TNCV_1625971 [Trichonephila clavipes]
MTIGSGRSSLVVKVSDLGWLVTNSRPVPLTMGNGVKSVESSNILRLTRCGGQERGERTAKVSSSSLDQGSKLRGPSP